jgi:antirestriction protein
MNNKPLMHIKQDEPSACIVCLSCLNNGRVLGKWISAHEAAAEIDDKTANPYAGQGEPATYPNTGTPFIRCQKCGGDEWEIVDHELLPLGCSTVKSFYENAEQLDDLYNAGELDTIHELATILDSGGVMSLDELARYHADNYAGKYDSEREFGEDFAESVGDANAVPEHMRQYIDWEYYARELMYNYMSTNGHYWQSV